MSAARIREFCNEVAWADGVREHVSGLLHALYNAAEQNAEAAVRYWRVASAAMAAPLRPLHPGGPEFEPALDKYVTVLALASDWRNRHGDKANAAPH
jgi:hypothetical protein